MAGDIDVRIISSFYLTLWLNQANKPYRYLISISILLV